MKLSRKNILLALLAWAPTKCCFATASKENTSAWEDLAILAHAATTPEMHNLLAQELFAQGRFGEANRHWKQSILGGFVPNLQDTASYAQSTTKTDDPVLSCLLWKNLFERASQDKAPIQPRWHLLYAKAAINTSDFDLAAAEITHYLPHANPDSPAVHLIAAQSYMMTGQLQKSAQHWRAYFKCEPTQDVPPITYYNAAHIFKENGMERLALKTMKKYLAVVPYEKCFPDAFSLAGKCAFFQDALEESAQHWTHFFSHPETHAKREDYAFAGLGYDALGKSEEAIGVLGKILLDPERDVCETPAYAICLASAYARLKETDKALMWFDHVFFSSKYPKISLVSQIPMPRISLAAALYLASGQTDKACHLLTLSPSIKVPTPARRKAPSSRKIPAGMPAKVGTIRAELKQGLISQCDSFMKRLEKLSFSGIDTMAGEEETRHLLMARAQDIQGHTKQNPTLPFQGASSSAQSSPDLPELQTQAHALDGHIKQLERLQNKAQSIRRKTQAAHFLETLGLDEGTLTPVNYTPNIRAQFGHEKPALAPAPSLASSSSSSSSPPSQAAPLVHMYLLKSVESDLVTLRRTPGLGEKYDLLMDEITQDPFAQALKSGKVKTLVGAKGIFSRRLDDANRLVYRVETLEDGRVRVCVLSVLGHYKHLKSKLSQTRDVPPKAVKPAKPKKKAPSKKKRK